MNNPRTLDDLSKWFFWRFIFVNELIIRSRQFPTVHSWAMSRMADLLRPLPVRLQDELLGDSEEGEGERS